MNEEEEFFAWLDGELDAEQASRVAARVAASSELTVRADEHRRLTTGLRAAFDPIVEAGMSPPRFVSAEVIDFGARVAGREARKRRFAVPQWAAMAATLVLGLAVGNLIGGRGAGDPVQVEGGHLVAAAALDQALDTQLASAPADKGARVGLSFRDTSGHVCRSFSAGPASGLACRDRDAWRIRGLFQGDEGQSSDYRMAAGQDPRLAALIDETISGEPFDAAEERAARQHGWR